VSTLGLQQRFSGDNARENRRFVFRKQFEATFGGISITLIDLSRSGAQAEHEQPLCPGAEGAIELGVPGVRARLTLRAKVVWTRTGSATEPHRTGLAIIDGRFDLAADLLDQMVRLRWVEVERNRDTWACPASKTRSHPPEVLGKVHGALTFVGRKSAASRRWLELVAPGFAPTDCRPIEVYAAWELLGRSVSLDAVAQIHRERETFVLSASDLIEEIEDADLTLVEA
jgi:hypothetical protein